MTDETRKLFHEYNRTNCDFQIDPSRYLGRLADAARAALIAHIEVLEAALAPFAACNPPLPPEGRSDADDWLWPGFVPNQRPEDHAGINRSHIMAAKKALGRV